MAKKRCGLLSTLPTHRAHCQTTLSEDTAIGRETALSHPHVGGFVPLRVNHVFSYGRKKHGFPSSKGWRLFAVPACHGARMVRYRLARIINAKIPIAMSNNAFFGFAHPLFGLGFPQPGQKVNVWEICLWQAGQRTRDMIVSSVFLLCFELENTKIRPRIMSGNRSLFFKK